ncbi:DUF1223 domain-containing protein [Paracoccus litorisediminis]|uniref:DUF1223 domain-containing protein n=1 Tax=Paracoccus litorisediminis TaxID=2006130 RepID=UPI00372FA907
MAFGMALGGTPFGGWRRTEHRAGLRRRLTVMAVIASAMIAQPVLAQDAGPGDSPMGGVSDGGHVGEGWGDSPIGDTATADVSGSDDGQIGLIEAPEGANHTSPATSDLNVGTIDDMDGLPAFAERRTAQGRGRMVGPIGHPPVVVELFTSQGCSSCPPADEMLNDLAERDDILALSWHVDYWDYLGWADDLARPEFTLRQQAYAHTWGERAIYTPQMVVGGADTLIAVRPAELMALIETQMARPAPVLVTSAPQGEGFQIDLTPREPIRNRVAILLVRYLPERQIEIRAGENRGMQVTYRNVVLAAERVGEWDGRAPLRMTVTAEGPAGQDFPPETRHAILAQETSNDAKGRASGPILAAIRLD